MKNQQQFGTLEVQPNFPWGKVLFVLLFLFLLVGQCFSQITASEARENTLKDDSEPIIQLTHRAGIVLHRVEKYSNAGYRSLRCCRHGMRDKTRSQLESLGYRVTERPDKERLRILDRELYIISW
jgi:hypothetical protein